MKTVIISGAFGQDAKFLSDLLASEYNVVLVYRYSSVPLEVRAKHYSLDNVALECIDICDPTGINRVVQQYEPFAIYNLAAQSHVGQSFKDPQAAFEVNTKGVLNWLEAIRKHSPETRFLQASTSELWGSNYSVDGKSRYQDEQTPFSPNSPYAAAKLAAHNLVRIYRDSYHLFSCSSICHNHEAEALRGENFVTRKITKWIGDYMRANGCFNKLRLGNIDAVRDWSHAADMVRGMKMICEHSEPRDFVLCSGIGHSVRDFMSEAFTYAGLGDYNEYFVVDPQFYRPCEVEYLRGRADLAREILGWSPQISFAELVRRMVDYDAPRALRESWQSFTTAKR